LKKSAGDLDRRLAHEKGGVRARLWHELLVAARFGMIGVTATAVHVLIVWLLLSGTSLPPLVANMFAFLTAFGISFAGNYLWTFRSPGNPIKAMRRFLLISVSAFAVNTLLLAGLLRGGWFSPTAAAIVSAAVVPMITFLAARLWGFRDYKKVAPGSLHSNIIMPETPTHSCAPQHPRPPDRNG
jgi:putative flippase GtrA